MSVVVLLVAAVAAGVLVGFIARRMSLSWIIAGGGGFLAACAAFIALASSTPPPSSAAAVPSPAAAATQSIEALHPTPPKEDAIGVRILQTQQLYGSLCEKIVNPIVFDRIIGTASANNHPAYVLGYNFNCLSNFGSEKISIYVGWMENSNTNRIECIHHNEDRNRVVSEGWHFCGGNFRQR